MDRMDLLGRRNVLQVAGLGAAALFIAGCGGGKTGSAPISGKKTLPINIVNTGSNNTMTLQALMKQQGYLEEFGLDPTTINVADGSKLMGSLISGGNDITMLSGFGQVLTAIQKGAKLKLVAGAGVLTAQAVFTKKPEIKTLKDLEGRTVGTGSQGALLYQLMDALLTKSGVDVSKVTFVNIGSSADVFKAVVAGKVDAGPSLVDVFDQQEKYGVHSIAEMWKELPEYTYQGAYVSEKAIAEKRDNLVRTLAAHAKLFRFIQSPDSKDAFMRAYATATGKGDPVQGATLWQFSQDYKPYAVDLVLSPERVQFMQQLNLQEKNQTAIMPYERATDMSLARDAIKLLG